MRQMKVKNMKNRLHLSTEELRSKAPAGDETCEATVWDLHYHISHQQPHTTWQNKSVLIYSVKIRAGSCLGVRGYDIVLKAASEHKSVRWSQLFIDKYDLIFIWILYNNLIIYVQIKVAQC